MTVLGTLNYEKERNTFFYEYFFIDSITSTRYCNIKIKCQVLVRLTWPNKSTPTLGAACPAKLAAVYLDAAAVYLEAAAARTQVPTFRSVEG